MSDGTLFLAVFLGSADSETSRAWAALSDADRAARTEEGIAAWKAWALKHEASIASMGGPLGKTKRVSRAGIEDVKNAMAAFTVVRAESHERAAELFLDHPHFVIFPGEAVEIMPVLPIPGEPAKITVEAHVGAPMDVVWSAYTTPADIEAWNAASPDWHTTRASVDLREGGEFCARMEAKNGSMGFDFAGTYTRIVPNSLIEYKFGDRRAKVEFTPDPAGVLVRVTFDAERAHSLEQQRTGWQAILDNFARHAASKPRP